MADSILKIRTQDGDKPIGYPGLADKPVSDETLSIQGAFADAKVVGDKFEEAKAETGSLKKDLGNLSSSKISKFYATNNGENHLADSDDGKIADMLVYGKSEQKSTTGAQLFDMSTAFAGWVSDDGTPRNDGAIGSADNIVSDYIPVEGNTVYSCNNNNNIFVWEYDSSKTLIKSDGQLNSESFTTAENSKFIVFAVSYSSAQTPDYIKTIMFNKGSSVLPWEPYTGGKPSPSPDYPQEIKSVVNPTVKVCGKNLWNPILGGYISGIDGSIASASKKQIAVTDFIKTSGKDITVIARNFSSAMEISYAYRIGFYNAEKKWIQNAILSDGNKHSINTFNITGTEYIRVSAPAGIYDTIQIEYGSEATSYEPYTEQSVQLPYTLNAIPVTSGGNVTIDGQQYIADYVDVERGKLVRCVGEVDLKDLSWRTDVESIFYRANYISNLLKPANNNIAVSAIAEEYRVLSWEAIDKTNIGIAMDSTSGGIIVANSLSGLPKGKMIYVLLTPTEIDLTPEEIAAFKALATYYPATNISVNSEQLDGLTVFNYPISMANGWNYVKQQLNDNRDYIYDMDTKTQDIDTQAAEAYVNSEYAVALTELEV